MSAGDRTTGDPADPAASAPSAGPLAGEVALVTGASRGIGQAIAIALAASGAQVIGTATGSAGAASIATSLGAPHEGVVLDVNDAAACEALVERIVKTRQKLSILVNNAGITRDNLAMRMKDSEWNEVIDTNLTAVFRMSRLVIRPMMKSRHGRIINTVQHFEDFWSAREALPIAELSHARVFELPRDKTTPWPDGVVSSLRIEIDHVALAGPRHDIGGYRLWMREAAGSGAPWRPLAIVQVLPPLVKAYAPIETGRLWMLRSTGAEATQVKPPTFTEAHVKRLFRVDGTPVWPPLVETDETRTAREARERERLREFNLPEAGDAQIALSKTLREDGTALLAFVKKLADAGFAAEHILSVSQRRWLERANLRMLSPGDPAAPVAGTDHDLPVGNWLLFKDQNGHVLGRAWSLWGEAVTKLKLMQRAELVEVPNLQDTVGADDFGKASWTWHGITDPWGHDSEWIVEPLDRYAPLLQRIHAPPPPAPSPATAKDTPPPNPNDRYRRGADSMEHLEPPVARRVHKYRVQRTAPLAGEGERQYAFGVVQRFVDHQFVFRVFAPDEFRLATGNSVARSAYGVLGLRVRRAERRFALADHFKKAGKLLATWMGDAQQVDGPPDATSLRYVATAPGEAAPARDLAWCELVVDEPDCLTLDLVLQPFADAMAGVPFSIDGAGRSAPGFSHGGIVATATLIDNQLLKVDLPRLDWSYAGTSRPPLWLMGLPEPSADLPAEMLADLERKPLLRLPDPMASIHVQLRGKKQEDPYKLVAVFLGPGADASGFSGLEMLIASAWGKLLVEPNTFRLVPVAGEAEPLGLTETDPATLCLRLVGAADPVQWRVTYRRGSASMRVVVN